MLETEVRFLPIKVATEKWLRRILCIVRARVVKILKFDNLRINVPPLTPLQSRVSFVFHYSATLLSTSDRYDRFLAKATNIIHGQMSQLRACFVTGYPLFRKSQTPLKKVVLCPPRKVFMVDI